MSLVGGRLQFLVQHCRCFGIQLRHWLELYDPTSHSPAFVSLQLDWSRKKAVAQNSIRSSTVSMSSYLIIFSFPLLQNCSVRKILVLHQNITNWEFRGTFYVNSITETTSTSANLKRVTAVVIPISTETYRKFAPVYFRVPLPPSHPSSCISRLDKLANFARTFRKRCGRENPQG